MFFEKGEAVWCYMYGETYAVRNLCRATDVESSMVCIHVASTMRRRGADGDNIAARPEPRPTRRATTGQRWRRHSLQTDPQCQFLIPDPEV
eukprot:8017008-Pyramimonas_sp.AAC.1